MGLENIRKRVDEEVAKKKKSEEEAAHRKEEVYMSLPTVKEWDSIVTDFCSRMFKAVFPNSYKGPKVRERMRYSKTCVSLMGSGGSFPISAFEWLFEKEGASLGFRVAHGFGSAGYEERNPKVCRGCLEITNHFWHGGFRSREELESAFNEVFERFYEAVASSR